MKPTAFLVALFLALVPLEAASAAGYRLDLEFNPAAPFPFLSKFGSVEISLFPGGVSGKAPLLRGFSRNGSSEVTVMSPISRMYVDLAIQRIRPMVLTLGGAEREVMPGLSEFPISKPMKGKVKGLDARRYRIQLGPESSMDVWTTSAIPPNPSYLRLAHEFIGAISQPALKMARSLEGTPVYVELNTTHHKKLPLLRIKSFTRSSDGEAEALKVGALYLKAPGADKVLGAID